MRTPKNVLIDNVAVRRRIAGDHAVSLTPNEKRRAIRVLHGRGNDDRAIAKALGYSRRTISTTRRRMGLPALPKPDRHAEYGLAPHSRRKALA
jgi:DNA-binding CsgD family transcriptional regulator